MPEFTPPIEQVPPGRSFCIYHGDIQLVDEDGHDAATGICRYCWQELRDKNFIACGTHGLQPRKDGIEGCPVCAEVGKVETPKFAPPPEEFGDTQSEPALTMVEEAPPAHTVEPKPEKGRRK